MDNVNIESGYHHGDLKTALIHAGLRLLDEEGVEAVGIRRLAREIGVAHSAPANHFPTRKALLTALAIACFAPLATEIETMSRQAVAGEDKVIRIAQWVIQYGLTYPHRYRLMFRWDHIQADDKNLTQVVNQAYAALLAALKEIPLKPAISLESAAISLWSLVHGYTVMRIEGTLIPGKDEVTGKPRAEAIVEHWLAGTIGP